jgi:inosine-uridine nucleoside N-ribohydrolase
MMRTTALSIVLGLAALACAAQRRMVLIDQDGAGPGGSDQMAMLALLQSPEVEVLGITIVTGDGWRDEETQHTLRMLELTGHANIPVARGAKFPLVRSEAETRLAEQIDGHQSYLGAWQQVTGLSGMGPHNAAAMPEGQPSIKAIDEDAAHFLIRQVRAHPHEVTIYAAGPLTNIALAIAIDPEFASLTKGIALMGGSLNPRMDDAEVSDDPRHEFNFWFDPEAAHIVLRADWPRIDVTTDDVTRKAPFTQEILNEITKSPTPAARYIAAWSQSRYFMWDELAACALIDPKVITKEKLLYMDVDLSRGPHYGDTLTWNEDTKPATGVRLVHAQLDLDLPRFQRMFVQLMTAPSH